MNAKNLNAEELQEECYKERALVLEELNEVSPRLKFLRCTLSKNTNPIPILAKREKELKIKLENLNSDITALDDCIY